jgi:hypothetical protein
MEQRSRFRAGFNRVKPGSTHEVTAQPTTTVDPATSQPAHQSAHQPAHHATAPAHDSPKPKKLGFFYGRKWLLVVILLLVVLFGGLTYMYIHTKNELNAAKNPTAAGKTETEKIINNISKSVELPTGETPTLATVNDVAKLKTQAFFKNAQNGDKVLVYTKAGKAILYRPSTQKVIIYSFINTGAN